jgi:hypothetical protein
LSCHFKNFSNLFLSLIILAGFPYAKTLSGRDLITKLPAPTTVFSPISILSKTVTPKVIAENFPRITYPPVIEPADILAKS